MTQAEPAEAVGVSRARIAEIVHGDDSGIDIVRAYIAGLGGPSTNGVRSGIGVMHAGREATLVPSRL